MPSLLLLLPVGNHWWIIICHHVSVVHFWLGIIQLFPCRGDTLTAIAKRYNTTIDRLAVDNGIANVDVLQSGEKLVVPFRAAGVGKVCFSQDMLFVLYLLFDSNFPSVPGLEISRFHIPSYYLTSRSQMFNSVSQKKSMMSLGLLPQLDFRPVFAVWSASSYISWYKPSTLSIFIYVCGTKSSMHHSWAYPSPICFSLVCPFKGNVVLFLMKRETLCRYHPMSSQKF